MSGRALKMSQLKSYEDAFHALDVDGDGELTLDELAKILEQQGHGWTREQLKTAVSLIDQDSNGTVNIDEFRELMTAGHNLLKQHEMKKGRLGGSNPIDLKSYEDAFHALDVDGDGELTLNELSEILKQQGHSWTREQLKTAISLVDQDSNGTVDINEFRVLMTSGPALLKEHEERESHKGSNNNIDLKSYEDAFHALDVDGDGQLTLNELAKILEQQGHKWTHEQLKTAVSLVDQDSNGTVDIDEFRELMTNGPALLEEHERRREHLGLDKMVDLQAYEDAFRALDVDGDGELTLDELAMILEQQGHSWTRKQLKTVVGLVDQDSNGTVDIDEFRRLMTVGPLLLEQHEMLEAFKVLDRRARGYVSVGTLRRILTETGKDPLTEGVGEILRFSDTSGDGHVYYKDVVHQLYVDDL